MLVKAHRRTIGKELFLAAFGALTIRAVALYRAVGTQIVPAEADWALRVIHEWGARILPTAFKGAISVAHLLAALFAFPISALARLVLMFALPVGITCAVAR
jgi:hypothetical protein